MTRPALAVASRPDDSQPPARAGLPFRVHKHQTLSRTCVILEWENHLLAPDGRIIVQPMQLDIGNPSSPEGVRNHLGKAILDLIEQYRALEATLTPTLTECDRLRENVASLEHQVLALNAKVREQARLLEQESSGDSGRVPRPRRG